jgi:tape measure domain-containing protein
MALVLKTLSDSKDAQRDLSKLKQSVVGIEESVEKTTASFSKLAQSVAALATVAITFKGLTSVSDQITNLENRLKTVTKTQAEFAKGLAGIKDIALQTRSSLDSVARLYQRIAVNSDDIGINQRDTLKVTKAVAQTLKISGASAAEASSSLLQFGQAIGSGKLAGDELRATLESNVVLARIIADAFKVPIGDLKKLGEAGTLVSGKVLKGILDRTDELEEKFGTLGVTFEDAFANVGTSFTLLFSALKKNFLGSSNGVATFINNIALAIGDIAKNLDIFLYNARAKLTFFIFDAIMLFGDLWVSMKEVGKNVYEMLSNLLGEWAPTLKNAVESIRNFATATGAAILTLYTTIAGAISNSDFYKGLISGLIDAFNKVRAFVSQIFKGIKLPSINVDAVFKGLAPALDTVKKWARAIERWFWWLYDKVIGNSWIPDLVEGTSAWFRKLLGSPLDTLKTFATKANLTFSKISLGLSGAFALGSLLKYKKQLLALSAIAGGIGVYSLFKEKQTKNPSITLAGETKSLWAKLVEALQKFARSIEKWLGDSAMTRMLKQAFGVQDKIKGAYFGDKVDTNAYVGKGAARDQKERPFLHDLFNVLPSGWQLPIVTAVAGAISLGIVSTFQSSAVRIALISLTTTAAALFATKMIDPQAISQTIFGIVNTVLKAVSGGITAVIGGNALFNPKELLFFLAKLALVFKAGRDLWVKAISGVARAGTTAGLSINDYTTKRATAKELAIAERDIKNIPNMIAGLRQGLQSSRDLFAQQVRLLAAEKDAAGNVIGLRRAYTNAREGNVGRFGTPDADAQLQRAIYASDATKRLNERLSKDNLRKETDALNENKRSLAESLKAQERSITTRRENFINNARNAAGSVGGIVGGVAGFQLGTQITKGMTNSSEWFKMATILVTAMVAQMTLSFAAATAFGGIVKAITVGGAAFVARLGVVLAATNPWIVGAGIILAALYVGFKLFADLPETWKKGLLKNWGTESPIEALGKVPQRTGEVGLKFFNETVKPYVKEVFDTGAKAVERFSQSATARLDNGFLPGQGQLDLTKDFFKQPSQDLIKSFNFTKEAGAFSKSVKVVEDFGVSVRDTIEKTFGISLTDSAGGFNWKGIVEAIKNSTKAAPTSSDGTPGGSLVSDSGDIVGTLKQQLNAAKNPAATASLIASALSGIGAKDVNAKQLESQSPRVLGQLADAIDNIQGYTIRAAKAGNDSFIGKQFLYQADVGRQKLQELLDRNSLAFEPDSKFKTAKDDGDDKNIMTFGEQLDVINKTFPELNMTMEEFQKVSDASRNNFYKLAKSIAAPIEAINSMSLGGILGSETIEPKGMTEKFAKLEIARKESQEYLKAQLAQLRTPYSQFKMFFEKFSVNITEEIFNVLSDAEKFKLIGLKTQIEQNAEILAKPLSDTSISDKTREEVQRAQGALSTSLAEMADTAARNIGTRFKILQNNFSYLGLDIERAVYNRLTDNEKVMMENVAKRLNSLRSAADNGDVAAQVQFEQVSEAVRNFQWSKFNSTSRGVGEAFANDVYNNFNSGLSDFLKGKQAENKSAWQTFTSYLLDTFTSNVIDTFTRGVTSALVGEKSDLNSLLVGLGSGIFGLGDSGGKLGTKSTPAYVRVINESIAQGDSIGKIDPIGDAVAEVNKTIGGVYKDMKDKVVKVFDDIDFGGIFDSIASAFKGFDFGSIFSIFGFANGGQIVGPGTGTSDSIPLLASNGEFIVNARQARRYAPMLHAINNGQLPRFAEGGMVGSMSQISGSSTARPQSTQVINLNITGDISRQTKAEIYAMLPQIANGVNSHNREQGFKG